MSCVDPEILRARAYLSWVAEPPAPALALFVRLVGPLRAAAEVRSGAAGGSTALAAETRARRETDRSAADLEAVAARGGRLLVPEDPEWPLAHLSSFTPGAARAFDGLVEPLALWVRGPLEPGPVHPGARLGADDRGQPEATTLPELLGRSVAVVGARAASDYGLWVARDWAASLADHGVTVVSGAALGIDGAAHRGALAAAGPTVAVLACGLDLPYPPSHAGLLEHIARRGAVVSEYPPGARPARHRFLVRNRLVAALSGGTVVVEAGARSGARRTALAARVLGRPVMAVPGPVTSAASLGCHELVREPETVLVGRVEDVVEEVGRVGDDLAPRPWRPPRPTDGLDLGARRVYEALPGRAARSSARLAHDSGVDPAAVPTHLRDLAAVGLVEQDDGYWRRRGG